MGFAAFTTGLMENLFTFAGDDVEELSTAGGGVASAGSALTSLGGDVACVGVLTSLALAAEPVWVAGALLLEPPPPMMDWRLSSRLAKDLTGENRGLKSWILLHTPMNSI